MGNKTMEIKIRIEPNFYESLKQCIEKQGYSTISEFVRLSIREKINRECGQFFIEEIVINKE